MDSQRAAAKAKRTQSVIKIIAAASRVIGLRLCFHERLGLCRLKARWGNHCHPACIKVKKKQGQTCIDFDGRDVHLALAGIPEGRIHTCPGGWTEIAVPVFRDGVMAGVLFAGPCWSRNVPPPLASLPCVPNKSWLEDRREMLLGVAARLGAALAGPESYLPPSRPSQILRLLNERYQITLPELAQALNLSVSRTSHLVREEFGIHFKELALRVQFREAAHFLTRTSLSVAEVSRLIGIGNPNYFSAMFKKRFNLSPLRYRQKHRSHV